MGSKILLVATIAAFIYSVVSGQLFGGVQTFPGVGSSQQIGYKAGPAWGSLSQTHNAVGAGADFLSKQGHGISGSLNVQPGIGGQGSLRGQVGLLNTPNHHVNAFVQHDRFLNRDLKPIEPATNSAGINYLNKNGASAFVSGSHTHGSPVRGTVGGSIPIVKSENAHISVTGQMTFGHGMQPEHQVGIQGTINY